MPIGIQHILRCHLHRVQCSPNLCRYLAGHSVCIVAAITLAMLIATIILKRRARRPQQHKDLSCSYGSTLIFTLLFVSAATLALSRITAPIVLCSATVV